MLKYLPITGREFRMALRKVGFLGDDDLDTRVVIDSGGRDDLVRVYLERIGDNRLLEIATTLEGVKLEERHVGARHQYVMESPLNGFFTECWHQWPDGTRCRRPKDHPVHQEATT